MKKYIIFTLTLAPVITFAETVRGTYTLMQPLPFIGASPSLSEYLGGMMKLAIGVAGVLAVIRIVTCGISLLMATESSSARTEAKKCIYSAIGGLILAIASWTVLNTINPFLLSNDLNIIGVGGNAKTAGTTTKGDDPQPTQPGWYYRFKGSDGFIHNSPAWPTAEVCAQRQESDKGGGVALDKECFETKGSTVTTPTSSDEDAVRQALCGGPSCIGTTPIGVSKGGCPSVGATNCTNMAGLPGSAVDAIKGLQSACGCNILVTGGTEYWMHKSHAAGQAIFDLRFDGEQTALAKIIKSQGTPKPSFSGNQRWKYNGFWYTDEKSSPDRHWHVCIEGAKGVACSPAPTKGSTSSGDSSSSSGGTSSGGDSPFSWGSNSSASGGGSSSSGGTSGGTWSYTYTTRGHRGRTTDTAGPFSTYDECNKDRTLRSSGDVDTSICRQ